MESAVWSAYAMSLADEVLAEHKAVPVMNGERCGECEARFPCLPVRLATKLKAAEHVVEAAKKLQRDYEDEVPAYFAAGNLGHCHANPPLWDDPKRGSCGRCSAWMSLTEALAEYDKEAKGE